MFIKNIKNPKSFFEFSSYRSPVSIPIASINNNFYKVSNSVVFPEFFDITILFMFSILQAPDLETYLTLNIFRNRKNLLPRRDKPS